MASNRILSDKGLVRGTTYSFTIDGATYLFKTGARSKPVISAFEKGADGLPAASSHIVDFQKFSGEVMAYAGVAEPSQLKPFQFDGLTSWWALCNLTLNQSTEALRSYTCEVTKLAGTASTDFTETP